mmetsp:Transcript_6450/g.13400  ORF Transcript_6450/g.13400 Transcript_6450/m.13400 type:complete len:317 (-) Transcript_6450:444-1394(-)
MNLASPSSANWRTPFERYKSRALCRRSSDMKLLNCALTSGLSDVRPNEPTPDRSCFFLRFSATAWSCSCAAVTGAAHWSQSIFSSWPCSWESSWPCSATCSSWPWPWPCCASSSSSTSNSSRAPSSRSTEKEFMLRIFLRSTRERSVSISSANELMDAIVFFKSISSCLETRSILFMRILSENAICVTDSLMASSSRFSLMCSEMNLQSTRQMMPSTRKWLAMTGFWVKVATTGAGFASPVVSTRTRSKSPLRSLSCVSAFIRSPRTVQHAQPLSRLITSSATFRFSLTSASSMLTAPNSFSITQIFMPWSGLFSM